MFDKLNGQIGQHQSLAFVVLALALNGLSSEQLSVATRPVQAETGIIKADSLKCDGKSDDTAPFNRLIASAVATTGPSAAPVELLTIELPAGKCRFASPPKTIPAGIKIVGNGNRNGTWLIADYDEPNHQNGFLTWNGSLNAEGGGAGGGLQHLHISKGSGRTGGTAIKLTGVDDAHRASFMIFDDLYINSAFGAPGFWNHHLVADGSCCGTRGSNGIRDIILTNFHFAQSKPAQHGESVLILNGVHIYLSNGLIFASESGGIRITGLDSSDNHMSHDVLITNVTILGSLYIDNAEGVVYNGWLAGKLITAATSKHCFVSGLIDGSINNAGACGIITDQALSISGPIATRDDDSAGILTLHNGSATHLFHHRFLIPPVCTASDNQEQSPVRVAVDVNGLTIKGEGNHQVSYICIDRDH